MTRKKKRKIRAALVKLARKEPLYKEDGHWFLRRPDGQSTKILADPNLAGDTVRWEEAGHTVMVSSLSQPTKPGYLKTESNLTQLRLASSLTKEDCHDICRVLGLSPKTIQHEVGGNWLVVGEKTRSFIRTPVTDELLKKFPALQVLATDQRHRPMDKRLRPKT